MGPVQGRFVSGVFAAHDATVWVAFGGRGAPSLAIEFVLERAGLTINDVDHVVFYEKPFVKFERLLLSSMATFPRSSAVFRESMQRWITDKLWIKSHLLKELGVPGSKVLFADHHVSHAASTALL